MKIIGEIKIENRDDEIIDITIPDIDTNESISFGVTKKEAIGIAYYLLGLTDNMED